MGEKQPITVEEGLELKFETPSARSSSGRATGQEGLRSGAEVHQARRTPAGYFTWSPDALRSTLQPHAVEPVAHRPDARKRNLDQRRDGGEAWRQDGQYVRLKNHDGVETNRIKVKATQRIRPDRVHGLRLRTAQHDGQGAFQRGASAARSIRNTRPIRDGRHQHPRELRHLVKEA